MTPIRKPAPATGNRPSRNTTNTAHNSPSSNGIEIDKRIVDQTDEGIWTALFNGHFLLAVPCEICGRALTSRASKEARRGSTCAAKAVQ